MRKTFAVILTVGFLFTGLALGQAKHPSELKYAPLKFDPPDPKAFRTEYANGLRAYVQEDRDLPLFNISAMVRFGNLDLPKEKTGLGRVMSGAYVQGGTKTRQGEEIQERIDFLGGSLSFNVGDRTSTLSLSVLSKDIDEGLALFFDVLMNPAFRTEELDLVKIRLVQQLRQANDQPSGVLSREFGRLAYGDNVLTWEPTRAAYEGIGPADLAAIHDQFFFPKNMILAVSGDFRKADLKSKIDKAVSAWKNKPVSFPALPKSFPSPEAGVYFVQMATNQGYISLGHLGIEDTNPDYYAVQVMNFILGGGSFTSRITMKVRSDEGLSYNQGSRFTYPWGYPGTFTGYVQTKSSTVGYAISLILEEFKRIRSEPVTDAEMETAVNYYLESFAGQFEMPQSTMSSFASLEMEGKPLDYYKTYRDRITAVTKAKVQEVARKYVHPDRAVIMIVGDWEPCNAGGEEWPGPLEKLGKAHRVALRDPMTGQEIK